MKKKIILRGVISAVVTFLCAFALLTASFLPALSSLKGEAGLKKALESADYKERVRQEIKKSFSALSLTTGIDEEVTDAFLDSALTDEVIEKPVFAILGGEPGRPDSDALTEDLAARILTYAEKLLESGELEMTPDQWQETKEDLPSVASYYIDKLMSAVYLSGIYGVMGTALSFVARIYPYVAGTAAIVFAGSLILLIALQKKRVFPWLYAAFTGAGLLPTLAAALFLQGEWGMRIGIDPVYLRLFLNEILCAFARLVLICGIVLIFCGIAFCLAGVIMKKKTAAAGQEPEIGKERAELNNPASENEMPNEEQKEEKKETTGL